MPKESFFMRVHEVAEVTGFSISTIYRIIEKHGFPKPVKIGERISLWKKKEVNNWLENLAGEEKTPDKILENKQKSSCQELSIDTLDIPETLHKSLKDCGIYTMFQLLELNETELLKVPYLGRKKVSQIKLALENIGMRLLV